MQDNHPKQSAELQSSSSGKPHQESMPCDVILNDNALIYGPKIIITQFTSQTYSQKNTQNNVRNRYHVLFIERARPTITVYIWVIYRTDCS